MTRWIPALGHPFWKLSAIIALVVLLILTLMPTGVQLFNIKHIDKVFHFIAFSGVTFLLMSAFLSMRRLWIGSGMLLIGFAIEVIQHQIPGRSFSLLDFLADACGVFIVLLLFHKRHKAH
ncbi:MAG: VanZ family protein [Gammaproteobacteria bacterium]|nr:VanZ family protein [Gammaproteobacteria bacterium]NVK87461.1 VanZ family protein [Gammaproteobacteria bacterium]